MKIFRQSVNVLKESIKGIFRNSAMSLASIISIAAMLTLFGFVFILILGINSTVYRLGNELDKVVVYLEDNVSADDVNNLMVMISGDERVKEVKYTSKEEALEDFKKSFGDRSDILASVEKDIMPASLVISLKDLSYSSQVASMFKDNSAVFKVKYHYDLVNKMINLERGVKYVGYAIVAVLFFVSILIIHNTVKIGVSNRQREINIMKYVGATNGYIRGPFLIEGIIFGVIGALIAFIIVYNIYNFCHGRVGEEIKNYGINILDPKSIFDNLSFIFLSIGVGVGYIGSLLSTSRFLDV
ncbi:permease-like cell division protein FtsX [Peptoniphilus catoniae]|uniref:permease-like cell division protein FtsX n=1 Tax=Peptoniphilus catoniae TaxID=1660341 RepID=UPI0010FEDF6A|nr:permease-like cell division protein FtsX [Peptoniphilus catoniae]